MSAFAWETWLTTARTQANACVGPWAMPRTRSGAITIMASPKEFPLRATAASGI